jgi:hypothetical protein
MNKQKSQSKVIIALSVVIMLLVALSATLTFAFFSAQEDAKSASLTFGKLGVNINAYNMDLGDAGTVSCSVNTLVPGCSLVGDGTIQIKNNIDTFLRFRLTMTDFTTGGQAGSVAEATAYGMMFGDGVLGVGLTETDENTFIIGGTAATAGSTKYYYTYIPAGSITTPTTVMSLDRITFTIPTTLGNTYQGATFKIQLEVQAIQAEHLTDGSDPFTAPTLAAGAITALGDLENATAWAEATESNAIDYFA